MSKRFNPYFPRYQDDSDYTTNANSYYDDLARKQKLIQELSERIWEYDQTLDNSLKNIEKALDNINHKIGEGFNDEIEKLLVLWIEDGTLDHIINETLMNKKADLDYVNKQLDEIAVNIKKEGVTNSVDIQLLKTIFENSKNVFIPEGVYTLNDKITIDLKTDLSITSNNAVLSYTGTKHVDSFITFNLNGYDLTINGVTLDSNRKANKTLQVLNKVVNSHKTDFTIEQSVLKNARRIKEFPGGENLFIRGGFEHVLIDGIESLNVTSELDSSIEGSQGLTGITGTYYAETSYIKNFTVKNSYVEHVRKDEGGYIDQDGIRHLTPHNIYSETIIENTKIKNTGGRAIKSQTHFTRATNIIVIMDKGFEGAVIEAQSGSLSVDNVKYIINNDQRELVRMSANQHTTIGLNASNIKVEGTGNSNRVVVVYSSITEPFKIGGINISNIISEISSQYGLEVRFSGSPLTTVNININGFTGYFTDSLLFGFTSTPKGMIMNVNAINLINKGDRVEPIKINSPDFTDLYVHGLYGLYGFKETAYSLDSMPVMSSRRFNYGVYGGMERILRYDLKYQQSESIEFNVGFGHIVEVMVNVNNGYKSWFIRANNYTEIMSLTTAIDLAENNNMVDGKLTLFFDRTTNSLHITNGINAEMKMILKITSISA